MVASAPDIDIRDEWGSLAPAYVAQVRVALDTSNRTRLATLTQNLYAADLADLIQALDQPERVHLIALLGHAFDVEALAELDEVARSEVMAALPADQIAAAFQQLDTDDALYLIEDLEQDEQREILDQMPNAERAALSRALDYPEESAGRLMQTDFVALPDYWRVGQAIDHLRTDKDLPDDFVELYVVDPTFRLKGAVALSRMLRSPRDRLLSDIMDGDLKIFTVMDSETDVAFAFEQYNLVCAPVIDDEKRLAGVIMVDDIVEIIQEEAGDDLLHLGGVGVEESLADTVWLTTRYRFLWLAVNLATAILASWVISWFHATIEQMVALAVLMPIVASMGGNAGTQTMTVAVRALATRDLGPVNALRVVVRECAVGLINGLVFALIVGVFALWWFGSSGLGLVIAAAMIINLVAAALAGILVPLALDNVDIDPAVASGVFVTTVTDVVGFFSFLGLAALWLV